MRKKRVRRVREIKTSRSPQTILGGGRKEESQISLQILSGRPFDLSMSLNRSSTEVVETTTTYRPKGYVSPRQNETSSGPKDDGSTKNTPATDQYYINMV